jgi:hydroxymethylbilane synthase
MRVAKPIRLATRGSALALWQANRVSDLIRQILPDLEIDLVIIKTKPDRLQEVPLESMGGDKGLFVKELELALLDGRADAAVHSLKDVPVEEEAPGLELVAFPERADPSDVLLVRGRSAAAADGAGLDSLPAGAIVATSALRRQAQVLRARPDLKVIPVRGNVDTRIRKLEAGEFDAIIMAAAGIDRLGLQEHISQRLPLEQFLPAPGQGIMVVQAPVQSPLAHLWQQLDQPGARLQARAERQFSRQISATCHSAAACLLELAGEAASFRAAVFSPDGRQAVSASRKGKTDDALNLASQVAEELLSQGCQGLV